MPGLKFLLKLVKILHSDTSPNEIAGGFILGMIIGLTPTMNLHNLIILFIMMILNVNFAMGILGFGVFSAFAYLFDSIFHDIGYYLLVDLTSVQDFWISLYNTPIVALTNFNNTVVMGSLVSSILLLAPIFFITRFIVINYREKILAKIEKFKFVQMLKGSRLYDIYQKVGG